VRVARAAVTLATLTALSQRIERAPAVRAIRAAADPVEAVLRRCSAMPMSSPNASQRRSKARPLAAALGLLSVTAVGALLFARAHAHREWPAMTAPLALEPPAVRADRAAWPAFERAIAALPPRRDRSALGDAQPDGAGAQIVARYAEALRLFDAALTSEAAPLLPERAITDASPDPHFALIDLARARALTARIDAANGRPAEALRVGVQLASFGARLGQQTTGWIGVAAAGAIEAHGYRAIASAIEGNALAGEAIEGAGRAIDELLAFESPLRRALAGECRGREQLFESFRGKSAAELLSTTSLARPTEQRRGWSLLPVSWVYDADATIAAVRAECRESDASLRRPRGERRIAASRGYLEQGGGATLGQWLDNRLGRALLSISDITAQRFVARDDDAYATRYTARVALAIAAFRGTHQRLPATLAELAPPASPQPLPTPRALTWSAEERTLRVALGPDANGSAATAAVASWRFAQ
jgi:hypothetical protein